MALIADMVGLLLLCAMATWIFVTALVSRSDPLATLLLLSLLAGGTIAGRLAPRITPMVVLGVATLILAADPFSFVSRNGAGFPFEYENAKGAFLVQAAAAGVIVARWNRSKHLSTAALTGTILFGVSPFLFGSVAAGILGLVVIGMSLTAAMVDGRVARLLAVLLAAVLLVTVAGTIIVGSAYPDQNDSAVVGSAVDTTLSERRRLLWGDAFDEMQADPLFGAGPGNFEQTSALALSEEDIRWVPSVFLEQAAETGLPGLVLVTLIFLWGLGRLLLGGRPGWLVAVGGAALFAVGVHGSMDYILHFPIVPLAAGAIFGSASSTAWGDES